MNSGLLGCVAGHLVLGEWHWVSLCVMKMLRWKDSELQ